jgi:hypothetical protein
MAVVEPLIPPNKQQRLEALRRYDILDRRPAARDDELARLP